MSKSSKQPKIPTVELIDPSYQPSKAELEEDLRIDAIFEELTAAVVRPVRIRYVKPSRKPR